MSLLKSINTDCKNPAKEEIKRISDESIQSVSHSNIKREDKFNEKRNSLKVDGFTLACRRTCLCSYTSQHHIDRYVGKHKQVEEKDNVVEKKQVNSSA